MPSGVNDTSDVWDSDTGLSDVCGYQDNSESAEL